MTWALFNGLREKIGANTLDDMYSQLKLVWNCIKTTSKSLNFSRIEQDYDSMRERIVEWLLQEWKITIKKERAETLYLDNIEVI